MAKALSQIHRPSRWKEQKCVKGAKRCQEPFIDKRKEAIEPPTLTEGAKRCQEPFIDKRKEEIEPPTLTGVWGNDIVRPSICQRFLVWG